ncbi:MAG TPA: hypothetical protein VFU72_12250 [Nitrolancea sp.]|nr:hypothetical protein [Nitrolancea sp.]
MLIGGVPYDASRDQGCADCGPNGRVESAQARVYRWAHDCQQSSQPACQTADGALADSVARLYGEYQCQGRDWTTSGFTALPPDWATSRHNDPALFASPTCGGVSPATAGSGASDSGGVSNESSNGSGQACVGSLCVSVSIPLPGPTQLAHAVLAALNWEDVLRQLLQAIYRVIVGDAFEQLGEQGTQILLLMPDLRTSGGAMGNIQRLVDALREAAVALCLVVFAFSLVQYLFGQESEPFGLFTRLGAVLFALAYYRLLLGWLLGGCNAVAGGILTIGADQTTDILPNLLKGLVPVTAPLWYLVALVGLVFLMALLMVKIAGFATLLILYVAGPLLLPLALHHRTAPWVGLWLEHLVKALLWPALWALELRLFGALANGLSLVDPTGHVALQALEGSALGALTALAMLGLMVVTPWGFHTRFTVRQGAAVLSRTAMRAADSVVLVTSGGTTMSARVALANSLAARRQPTEAATE